uniref:Uncharacterized protein n=1 Tax=Spongospora subterranea TaxID=70186 RepID=A0A0H5R7S7_9EUKA|eukprot:CRZ04329.1 hypothetical protein [Spongospora subterranea]
MPNCPRSLSRWRYSLQAAPPQVTCIGSRHGPEHCPIIGNTQHSLSIPARQMRKNHQQVDKLEPSPQQQADVTRIAAALSVLHEQLTQIDELLLHSPDDVDLSELKESVVAEMEQFKKQALELRKRKLLNEVNFVYDDNIMVSSIIKGHSL